MADYKRTGCSLTQTMQSPRRQLLAGACLSAYYYGAKVWPDALHLHPQTCHRRANTDYLGLVLR